MLNTGLKRGQRVTNGFFRKEENNIKVILDRGCHIVHCVISEKKDLLYYSYKMLNAPGELNFMMGMGMGGFRFRVCKIINQPFAKMLLIKDIRRI